MNDEPFISIVETTFVLIFEDEFWNNLNMLKLFTTYRAERNNKTSRAQSQHLTGRVTGGYS